MYRFRVLCDGCDTVTTGMLVVVIITLLYDSSESALMNMAAFYDY